METNSQSPISTQATPQELDGPAASPRTSNLFVIILIVIEGITLLVAGYFAYQFTQLKKQIAEPPATPAPVTSAVLPTTKPTIQPAVSLPNGWTYKSDACNVKFPLPPKLAPYYQASSGRFWDFPRGSTYPLLLGKLLANPTDYQQTSAMYAAEKEASGYISSAVVVHCIPNTGNLDNQGLLDALKAQLLIFNQSTKEKGMEANSYTIESSSEITKWDKKVLDLHVSEYFENSGGQPITRSTNYLLFATHQYLYEVSILGGTDDSFVKETAEQIFNNLIFGN